MANHYAERVADLIEKGYPEEMIGEQVRLLIRSLGGNANASDMTPGAAAVYLIALILAERRP